jgi:hypothetical protein
MSGGVAGASRTPAAILSIATVGAGVAAFATAQI